MALAEAVAVVLAIAYLVLAVRQSLWCWPAALASTAIYTVVFYDAALLMESALQVFYMAMAVYGFYQWRFGGDTGEGRPVTTWPPAMHALAIGAVLVATALSGQWLASSTGAALPFLDALTTWGAVVATFMVARKKLENWVYWFVIDSISIYLYLSRELYFTATLFAAYLVIIVFGYRRWRADFAAGNAGIGGLAEHA